MIFDRGMEMKLIDNHLNHQIKEDHKYLLMTLLHVL